MGDYRILIVDDIPTNVVLIAAIIKKLGAKYETAACGEEALAKVESFRPDIVLLDLMLPDIDGCDVIRSIRQHYTKEEMAIVVTSAISDYDTITECYNLGADDYIAKPIMVDRLLNTLEIHAKK